jgi:recombination protein RecA
MVKKAATGDKLLDSLRDAVVKKFGDDVLVDPDKAAQNEDPISTGILAFDLATGGGIPTGRITEVFGDFSTGKTLVAEHWLAQVQQAGGLAVWIASEDRLNAEYATKVGLDIKDMLLFESRYMEEVYDFQVMVIKTLLRESPKRYCGIVWDSIAQSECKQVLELSAEDRSMADSLMRAKMNSTGCRMIAPLLPGTKVACYWINQIREKPGVMYGPTTDTTGGKGVKFASSLRIHLTKGKKITTGKDGDVIGIGGKFEVVKSKVCPPFRFVEFSMTFENGIDPLSGLLPYLVRHGKLTVKTGGWYEAVVGKLGERIAFQSSGPWHEGFTNFVTENTDWLSEILEKRFL